MSESEFDFDTVSRLIDENYNMLDNLLGFLENLLKEFNHVKGFIKSNEIEAKSAIILQKRVAETINTRLNELKK